MNKYVALGALSGFGFGIIFGFINPWALETEVAFNIAMNERLGFPPDYYSLGSGSIYTVGSLAPLLFGIIGGLLVSLGLSLRATLGKKKGGSLRASLFEIFSCYPWTLPVCGNRLGQSTGGFLPVTCLGVSLTER